MASKYMDRNLLLAPISLVLLFLVTSKCCWAIESITQFQKLSEETTLVSPNQVFELGFFSPNNSASNRYVGIWYKDISPQTVLWVLNRENPISTADSPASLRITAKGNLELVNGNDKSVWSTNHSASSNSTTVKLLNSGDLVVKDVETNQTLWHSFDRLGDTLLPGSAIGFDGETGKNDVLTSWKSDSDPSTGDFTSGVSTKLMPAQVFTWNRKRLHWRSGPWDGNKFTGIPTMDVSYESPFNLIEDSEHRSAHLFFNPFNVSTKFFITPQGDLRFILKEKGRNWRKIWESRESSCDLYGFCGNFGVCEASKLPICRCLKGYVPISDSEWKEQNWTQGCIRRTELLCQRNNTGGKNDGFHELKSIKLPDLYRYLSLPKNPDDCRKSCMEDCICSAYAYVDRIGCLVWSESIIDVQKFSSGGEALFLRLAHRELDRRKIDIKTIIISLATILIAGSLCVFLVICLCKRGANRKGEVEAITEKSKLVKTSREYMSNVQFTEQKCESDFPIFHYKSLLTATDNFSISNKLGQGGFGPVYKGKLQDGTEIAVKRLSSSSGQGTREFENEMVLVSKLQHRNLVRLLGFCTENDEKLLVYEYLPNKSLDNFIFDSQRSEQLDWRTRYNIIIGIARGLIYLHRDSFIRVIHRDLKASNVLLDDKMNPKISDFGLAKIFEETHDVANTQRVVGTLGYMSPEYAMGGIFSEKSDVYSFGILILEIVSGRKNTSFHFIEQHLSLIGYAWGLWSEGREVEMVDKALENGYSSEEAMRCVQVGLLCVQDQALDRPTMSELVSMLMNETDLPRPKEPLFTFQRPQPQVRVHNDTQGSVNDATVSMLEGR